MKEYYGKRDCQNCIWRGTSCTKFYCQQITRSQITKALDFIELCDEAIANNPSAEDVAKIVAYEHIVEAIRGKRDDAKGS